MVTKDSRQKGYMTSDSPDRVDPIDAVRVHVSKLTGIDLPLVRQAWAPRTQVQPAMGVTWCSVELLQTLREGFPYFKRRNDRQEMGDVQSTNWQVLKFKLVFRGSEASKASELFCMGSQLPQHDHELRKYGLKVRAISPEVTIVPELYGNEWTRRYDVSLEVARSITRNYGVRSIVSADFKLITEKGEL